MPRPISGAASRPAEALQFPVGHLLEVDMPVVLEQSATKPEGQPDLAVSQSAETARYEIHDHATVEAPASRSSLLDIWSPVIPDTPYQRVLDIEVTAPC